MASFSPEVEFCGYSIPHPSEGKMNMRIQTYGKFFFPSIGDYLRRRDVLLVLLSEQVSIRCGVSANGSGIRGYERL